jgi:hypothetical protein
VRPELRRASYVSLTSAARRFYDICQMIAVHVFSDTVCNDIAEGRKPRIYCGISAESPNI